MRTLGHFRQTWISRPVEDVWLWQRYGWTLDRITRARDPRNGGRVDVAVLRRPLVLEVEDAAA